MNILSGYWCELYKGTPAELALEPHIAALGIPYRQQLPLFLYQGGLKFFPDVVLPTIGFIIEIDDSSHDEKQAEDAERTRLLGERLGYRVIRCTNDEAIRTPHVVMNRLAHARATLGDKNLGLPEPVSRKGRKYKKRKPVKAPAGKGFKCLPMFCSFLLR